MTRQAARTARSVLVLVSALLVCAAPARAEGVAIRPMWASRPDVDSVEAVRRAVSTAVTGGFNTLIVPASIFPSPLPSFDGLAEAVRQAHARGLRVHASIDINRVADIDEVPGARTQVLYEHPEWLMVPRALAPELLPLDVRSPDYIGRLARWTRSNAPRVGGVYLSPLYPDAAAHIAAAVKQLVERYMVDGVVLNEAQYPGDDFDYSRAAMDRFRSDLRPRLTAADQKRMDRIEALDPFAYSNEYPDEWRRFRQSTLTALVTRVRTAAKSVRAQVLISAGVTSDAAAALHDHLQDWRTWLDNGFVDAISHREGASGTIATSYDALEALPAVSAAATAAISGSH